VGHRKENIVSIGTGIVLFVIGAILAFAVNIELEYVSLDLIGYILMGAGVGVFLIGLVFLLRRRRSVATSRTAVDPVTGDAVTRRASSTTDDPPVV
jgi:Na+/proline symporter